MNDKTLIIRSASMERLDACAAALGGIDGRIDILTHAHFAQSIRDNYPSATVVAYPFDGNFSPVKMKRLARKGALARRYARVIVLAGNISGAGHLNVLRGAMGFGPVEIFNVNNEFLEKNPAGVAGEYLAPFALVLGLAGGVVGWALGRRTTRSTP